MGSNFKTWIAQVQGIQKNMVLLLQAFGKRVISSMAQEGTIKAGMLHRIGHFGSSNEILFFKCFVQIHIHKHIWMMWVDFRKVCVFDWILVIIILKWQRNERNGIKWGEAEKGTINNNRKTYYINPRVVTANTIETEYMCVMCIWIHIHSSVSEHPKKEIEK